MALLYRHDGNGPPRNCTVELADQADCRLEVLATGKALTFHGLHHETGRWFQWPDLNPLSVSPGDAPEVGAADVEAFLEAVAREFPSRNRRPAWPSP